MAIPASPIDWSKSRAYTSVVSTGEGVSVNLKGREPEGIVDPADYEHALEALKGDALPLGADVIAFPQPGGPPMLPPAKGPR